MNAATKRLTRAAVTAALYTALTLLVAPLSFGPLQFRVSEALAVLPLFYIEAVPGLVIGCLIANVFSGPWDMLFGTLATLSASLVTYFIGRAVKNTALKLGAGLLAPVIFNMFLVPVIFLFAADVSQPYLFNVVTVGIGELGAVYLLGVPLYFGLSRLSKRTGFLQ